MALDQFEAISREACHEELAGTDLVFPAPVDVDMLDGDWSRDVARKEFKAFLALSATPEESGLSETEREGRIAKTLARILVLMEVRRTFVIGRGLMGNLQPLSPSEPGTWSDVEASSAAGSSLSSLLRDRQDLSSGFKGALGLQGDPEDLGQVSEILAHGAWIGAGLCGLWTWLCPDNGLIIRSCHHRHLHTWPKDAQANEKLNGVIEDVSLVRIDGCVPS